MRPGEQPFWPTWSVNRVESGPSQATQEGHGSTHFGRRETTVFQLDSASTVSSSF